MKAAFQILNNSFSPTLIEGDIVEAVRVKNYKGLQGVYVIKEANRVTIQRIDSSSEIDTSHEIYKIERLISRVLCKCCADS